MENKIYMDPIKKEYVSNIPGRVRLRVDGLGNNPGLCGKLVRYLSSITGVILTTANPYTSKVLILYDIFAISIQEIEHEINRGLTMGTEPDKPGPGKERNKARKVLSLAEFRDSRNVLSKEYREYNVKTIHTQLSGLQAEKAWHTLTVEETEKQLDSHADTGLAIETIDERLKRYGSNQFDKEEKNSILSIFFKQFSGFIIKLLLAASGITMLLGHMVDAVTILAIVGIEASLGTWQEYRAERSLDLLKQLSAPNAKVLRGGMKTEIPTDQLVPGDIIYLEAGDIIPADARLIESFGLEASESSLTGESYPVYKQCAVIQDENIPLGDRSNMVYRGTSLVKGYGRAIIVATGMDTEMGKIARMLGDARPEKTPLQRDLDRLAKTITWGCLGICAFITFGGIIGGNPLAETFATGVSLAVGAIPEGLTAVLAISLAFGAQRMTKKNAIVKALPDMETLSCTRVICTDKTGTLTRNEMTVKEIYTAGRKIKVTGQGYNTRGSLLSQGRRVGVPAREEIKMLLTASALCNNAELLPRGKGVFDIKGDPTEAALLIAVEKSGFHLQEFTCYHREHENPFDPETKKMSAVCSDAEGNRFVFLKGAKESILERCTGILVGNSTENMSQEYIQQINEANHQMTDRALRVLALAYRPLSERDGDMGDPGIEENLIFLGLVGIMDPPRPEVKEAIKKCHAAGIKVVMITGDHKNTAAAIAKTIGLLTPAGVVLSGEDIRNMTEDELEDRIDKVEVFARTCPEQKLNIVKAFKKKGYIVAMTGDGVNDAPALKEAHIGIAMGKTGTDVAKDVSSIILADDNFSTVVKAVEEGRTIHRNVRKFMKYVLSGNFAEVLAIFLASISGMPSPMIPAQILMLNLVTEGIPALSLGVDPPEKDVMNELPKDPNQSIFDQRIKNRIVTRGIATGVTTLGIFGGSLFYTGNLIKARTMAFTNLVSCQMLHALECSSMGVKRNKYLLPAIAISSGITLASIYVPGLAGIFGMTALNLADWAAILVSTLVLSRIDDFFKDILYLARLRTRPSFGV